MQWYDWHCFYYSIRNRLVALLEALFARCLSQTNQQIQQILQNIRILQALQTIQILHTIQHCIPTIHNPQFYISTLQSRCCVVQSHSALIRMFFAARLLAYLLDFNFFFLQKKGRVLNSPEKLQCWQTTQQLSSLSSVILPSKDSWRFFQTWLLQPKRFFQAPLLQPTRAHLPIMFLPLRVGLSPTGLPASRFRDKWQIWDGKRKAFPVPAESSHFFPCKKVLYRRGQNVTFSGSMWQKTSQVKKNIFVCESVTFFPEMWQMWRVTFFVTEKSDKCDVTHANLRREAGKKSG